MADDKVQIFLNELELMDSEKFEIIRMVRREMQSIRPDVSERIIYGGIMFSLDAGDVGGVFPSKKHVSIEFSSGYLMNDPNNVLEGVGKFRRHIKIRSITDIAEKDVPFFLRQLGQPVP